MPGSWMSFHSLATEFHLGKCYSDPCKKRVVFVETGQVIRAFRAKETYIWEILSQWWKKVKTKQKIYFLCNVVNHYQWYTQMLYTVCPSRHPSNRQGFRNRVMWYWLRCSVWVLSFFLNAWHYCSSHHYIPVLTLPNLNWCNCSYLSRRKISKVCFAVLFNLQRTFLPMYVWNHLTQYMLNYSMLENFLEIPLHFFCKGIAYGM